MIYPRKYEVEEGKQADILSFMWEKPGYSLWGIRIIVLFLKFKMEAKIIHKLQSAMESQWIVQIGEDQLSIYQDDMSSLEVSIMNGSDPTLMKKIVTVFNNSIFFKNIKT